MNWRLYQFRRKMMSIRAKIEEEFIVSLSYSGIIGYSPFARRLERRIGKRAAEAEPPHEESDQA